LIDVTLQVTRTDFGIVGKGKSHSRIMGADHPDHSWFDIRAALHILFAATILGLGRQPLLIDRHTFHALDETA
jgi:hypothetical protein